VSLALLAALAACSKEAPPPAPAVQPPVSAAAVDGPANLEDGLRGAAEIEAKLPALRRVEGTLAMGDTNAGFEAFYEGAVLRYVEEEPRAAVGKAEKAYYLDSTGVLFYYHAEGERSVTRIAFDPAGNVRASEKTLDGQPAPLLDADIQAAVARLGALRQAAEAADRAR
jgi:hypothetical protein